MTSVTIKLRATIGMLLVCYVYGLITAVNTADLLEMAAL